MSNLTECNSKQEIRSNMPPKQTTTARTRVHGIEILRDPVLNKGMAFTLEERQMLGIHGLLPPALLDQDQQVYQIMQNFHRWENDLDRFIFMQGVQDRSEKLFYRVITENVELMMPIIYTPTVGLACQKYGMIFRKPRGLYITIHDLGHVYDILCNWPIDDVKAIVVTDGERILGLGDLGAYGMGIPVGKLSLYTACAGIKPQHCLPITIDVGTNNTDLLNDPLYIGLRQKRETGPMYDQLIDEFMQAVVKRYGKSCLVQFEDFGNHNAFRFLEKYRENYCTFNDDIQGTAAVAVAGILTSLLITKVPVKSNVFLFQGAGEASIGIAKLLTKAIMKTGLTKQEALNQIWLVDSKGLIVKNRPKGGVDGEKTMFAKDHQPIDNLEDIVSSLKPTCIIGAAAIPGAFNEKILTKMGQMNDRPIIFALSNPTSKAECTAEAAYTATDGRAVFASGSPFDPVHYKGKVYHPGQGNNAYVFPGIALAVIAVDIRCITEDVFLAAAESLAMMITKENLEDGRVYPSLCNIRSVSLKLAEDVINFAYEKDLAHRYPRPENVKQFLQDFVYDTDYDSFIPPLYDWPAYTHKQPHF
ncbi:NADP-dependent malic enzyme-like [Physella acuta]|uniref:NADP-dependent malic enzyme-like n=1 Tax=Physella acuta TaxID=109671 RepID=UPI0027DD39D0|nr:NADP-dependent malic enzyme-like [Physella acuta]